MIKSTYTDPRFNDHGFVKHIHHCDVDCGVTPGTTAPQIEAYKIEMIENLRATSGTGGRPRNLALFRKVLIGDPAGGPWQFLHMWIEGIDYEESSAAGSVNVLPDGTVHIVMAFGKKNAAGATQYQVWEDSIPRSAFAPPIERLPPSGAPGPPGTGGDIMLPKPASAPAWTGRVLAGGVLVDVPLVFGVPSARKYNIRFIGVADRPDIRIRAGTEADPYFVTMNTQIANLQVHTVGPTPGPSIYVSSVNNAGQPAMSTIWLQIIAYQP